MAKDFLNHFDKVTFLVDLLTEKSNLTIDQINGEWLDNIYSDGKVFDRYSLRRLVNSIRTQYGIDIKNKRRGKYDAVYYIDNQEDLDDSTNLLTWSFKAITFGDVLIRNKKLFRRILLENFPSGIDRLEPILIAMNHNHKVWIHYKKYHHQAGRDHLVAPLFLKEYHKRLYVMAMTSYGKICPFSLDRIAKFKETEDNFTMPKSVDAKEYFSSAFGIMVDPEKWPPQRVVLRAFADEPEYLRDVPIHESQGEMRKTDDFTDFEYYLGLTNDFIGKILERGDRIQVLAPQVLVDEVRRRIADASGRYTVPEKV